MYESVNINNRVIFIELEFAYINFVGLCLRIIKFLIYSKMANFYPKVTSQNDIHT